MVTEWSSRQASGSLLETHVWGQCLHWPYGFQDQQVPQMYRPEHLQGGQKSAPSFPRTYVSFPRGMALPAQNSGRSGRAHLLTNSSFLQATLTGFFDRGLPPRPCLPLWHMRLPLPGRIPNQVLEGGRRASPHPSPLLSLLMLSVMLPPVTILSGARGSTANL